MKFKYLQTKASLLLIGLSIMLSFQSCNKQSESIAPADANAVSADALYTGVVPTPCQTVCLVAGQHNYVGSVDVALAPNGDLLVTYQLDSWHLRDSSGCVYEPGATQSS